MVQQQLSISNHHAFKQPVVRTAKASDLVFKKNLAHRPQVFDLQQKCQSQCHHCRSSPDNVLVPLDNNLPESLGSAVVHQVLNAIDTVEHKRPGQSHLDTTLDHKGKRCKSSGHRGALQVPARERRDQVADAVGVETTRKDHAGEALEDGRAEPGLVLVVNLKMGGDGSSKTLLREEVLRLAGRHGLGGCGAASLEDGRCGCEEGGGLAGYVIC